MEEKRNALFTAAVIGGMLLILTIADLLFGSRLFVKKEGVEELESPTLECFVRGDFERAYETYAQEHFIGLNKYAELKMGWDILTFRKDFEGVYLGKKKQLFPVHSCDVYTRTQQDKSIAGLKELVQEWDAWIMAVPTADGLYPERLPAYADSFSQTGYLEMLKEAVGEEHYVDVISALREKGDEYLYYHTDSRWTSLGAYYASLAWVQKAGKRYPLRCDTGNMTRLSSSFFGDLYRTSGLRGAGPDSICVFPETKRDDVVLTYEDGTRQRGYYNTVNLRTEDAYSYFPGQEHGLIHVDTGSKRWKSLFVLKDSYGDCLIPFLAPYYKELYVADIRYYEGDMGELVEELRSRAELEVLIVGNVPELIERAGSITGR